VYVRNSFSWKRLERMHANLMQDVSNFLSIYLIHLVTNNSLSSLSTQYSLKQNIAAAIDIATSTSADIRISLRSKLIVYFLAYKFD